MYLVREVFIAKPGHAGEFAELMKKEMTSDPKFKGYVLLDMVTNYNKIVCEYEIESLAAWESMMMKYRKEAKDKQSEEKKDNKPPKYTELYLTGKREIYKIL
ncbi:hypothetical protein KW783_02570 [Candidatus Parcubacteria bacterium]|nr:hypothetical protein [Candidatus Parcubacteria bacterium]